MAQKGSLVTKDKLRFDFAHHSALTDEVLISIENIVNNEILRAIPAQTQHMDKHIAKASGAMALFVKNMMILCGS